MRMIWKRNGPVEGAKALVAACAIFSLAACAIDNSPRTALDWPGATYLTVVVRPGDRVDDIAARYNVAPSAILHLNDISANTTIRPGEVLRIPPGSRTTRGAVLREAESSHVYVAPRDDRVKTAALKPVRPVNVARRDPPPAQPQQTPIHVASTTQANSGDGAHFIWPVSGTVIESFGGITGGERNDGINIAAPTGTPIRAAQAGTITYAGNELRDYGNLILIQHDGGYITAYAHADHISVAKGQHVEQGQVIGTTGTSGDVTRAQVHFEIRRDSHPLDPRSLLGGTS